jgi:hypothetical protein
LEKETIATSIAEAHTEIPPPVIVDLGSKSKKAVKKLKKGTGKLMAEVEQAIEQVRSELPNQDKNKQIIPVLIIYRKKGKRGTFPFSPFSPLNLLR